MRTTSILPTQKWRYRKYKKMEDKFISRTNNVPSDRVNLPASEKGNSSEEGHKQEKPQALTLFDKALKAILSVPKRDMEK